jgi:hypothetical protein
MTAAFMLHLNALAADAACATHAGASVPVGASHHGSGGHGHGANAASQGRESVNEPCQTPSQAHCCEAMATCSTIGVGSHVCPARGEIPDSSMIDSATGTLLTRFIAPETPPPKA